jgi:AraC-like DNA-binding protein
MHRRTLNRRLHDEGTTFQAVLDDVRFELARQLISSSHIALDDVAASLGYAGASPFTRRFTRWSGMTPGDWRRHFGHDVTRMTQGAGGSPERM